MIQSMLCKEKGSIFATLAYFDIAPLGNINISTRIVFTYNYNINAKQ